ncbi:MAG: hypothetical protein NTX36_12295 [Proteobacteria bacterium]|nr:hypothetical protein [Pseudomonadota bacterium]
MAHGKGFTTKTRRFLSARAEGQAGKPWPRPTSHGLAGQACDYQPFTATQAEACGYPAFTAVSPIRRLAGSVLPSCLSPSPPYFSHKSLDFSRKIL